MPDSTSLLLREEVHRIVGCAMEVLNTLGHGLLEKPYEHSLAVEFGLQRIQFRQQPKFDVVYKSVIVGEYIPDLICFDQIVVDAKTIDRIAVKVINHLGDDVMKVFKVK